MRPAASPPIVKTRLIQLDVLRGIAILLVFGPHLPKDSPDMSIVLKLWHRGGWCGVDLFFVLSGFLIGGLLFDEYLERRSIAVSRFYIRRGFKIWPSYLLLIVFAMFSLSSEKPGPAAARFGETFHQLWPNFLHIQNYIPTPLGHTWSLAVEEHFYLLFPLLLLAMIRWARPANSENPFRRLPFIFIVVAALCLIARLLTAQLIRPFNLYIHFFPTHLRMDSLFAGVMLAYVVRYHGTSLAWIRRRRWVMLIVAVGLFVLPFLATLGSAAWTYTVQPTALAIGSSGLVLFAWFASEKNPHSSNPVVRLLSWIGVYSYSIYVWHLPLSEWIAHQIPARGWPGGIAPIAIGYAILAILLGAAMYRIVEFPALIIRNRLFPRPIAQPPQPQ